MSFLIALLAWLDAALIFWVLAAWAAGCVGAWLAVRDARRGYAAEFVPWTLGEACCTLVLGALYAVMGCVPLFIVWGLATGLGR